MLTILLSGLLLAAPFVGFNAVLEILPPLQTMSDIKGMVSAENGSVAGALISVYAAGDQLSPLRETITSVDGTFLLTNLPLGSYYLKADSADYTAAFYHNSFEEISTLNLISATLDISVTLSLQSGAEWLDNFSDKNIINKWNGSWGFYSDLISGGASTLNYSVVTADRLLHKEVLAVSYNLLSGISEPFVLINTKLNSKDISRYSGIKFELKGTPISINVTVSSAFNLNLNKTTNNQLKVSTNWQTFDIIFSNYKYAALSSVNAINWQVLGTAGNSGYLSLDNIRFITADLLPPELISASLNRSILVSGQISLVCTVTDNLALNYAVSPQLSLQFSNGATRNVSISYFAANQLSASILLSSSDPRGIVSVNLQGLSDISGNTLQSWVTNFILTENSTLADSFTVTVSTGLSSSDLVVISVPTGAVSVNISVSLNVIPSTSLVLMQNATLNGLVMDFKLVDQSSGLEVSGNLLQPLILRLPYNGNSIRGVVVRYLDTTVSPSVWKNDGIEVLTINTLEHFILVKVNHFTMFAVFSYSDINPPVIQSFRINNVEALSNQLITDKPVFNMQITDKLTGDSGIVSWSIEIQKTDFSLYKICSGNLYSSTNSLVIWDLSVESTLPAGSYTLIGRVTDQAGNSVSLNYQLTVANDTFSSTFFVAPNPVNINKEHIHFIYELNHDAIVQIKIFNLAGSKEKEFNCPPGSEGGKSGKNHLEWDGFNDKGQKLSTGVYIVYQIVNNDKGKSNKFMLMVIK